MPLKTIPLLNQPPHGHYVRGIIQDKALHRAVTKMSHTDMGHRVRLDSPVCRPQKQRAIGSLLRNFLGETLLVDQMVACTTVEYPVLWITLGGTGMRALLVTDGQSERHVSHSRNRVRVRTLIALAPFSFLEEVTRLVRRLDCG